jgi:hypothetical protein
MLRRKDNRSRNPHLPVTLPLTSTQVAASAHRPKGHRFHGQESMYCGGATSTRTGSIDTSLGSAIRHSIRERGRDLDSFQSNDAPR